MIARRLPFPLLPLAAWLVVACPKAALLGAETTAHAPAPAAAHKPDAPEILHETKGKAGPTASAVPAKRSATEIDGLLKIGAKTTERGDYDAADIAFRQVLNAPGASDAEVKTALLSLAQMHRKQGAYTKAVAIFEKYLKEYPDDDRAPEALLNLGRTLRSMGLHKLAISRFFSVLNSTLKVSGEGFDHYQVLAKTAQFEIAETHFQAGDFAQANKYFSRLRLLDLAPSDRARAHFMSGYSLRLQGDLEGSISMLRGFIEQTPEDENVPEARYLLAVTLRELKRTQEAFATTLDLLRTEKARTASDPKRWAYWQRRTGNQLANEFFESGDTLNARAIYAGLLELSTDASWRLPIAYQLGLCYERLGVNESARASYQAIVDAIGANPPDDLRELVTMAKWRIEHLAWREKASAQITSFFDFTTGKYLAASTAAVTPPKAAATP